MPLGMTIRFSFRNLRPRILPSWSYGLWRGRLGRQFIANLACDIGEGELRFRQREAPARTANGGGEAEFSGGLIKKEQQVFADPVAITGSPEDDAGIASQAAQVGRLLREGAQGKASEGQK
jgi:hypothetical protein